MRRENLHVHGRGQLPAQRLPQRGQPGARPVRGHGLVRRVLLDHDQPAVRSLVQGVELAAVLFGVHLPYGFLEGGDHLLAVLGGGIRGRDDDDGHADS